LAVDDVGDEPLYLQRVAALDVGKPQLEVCVPGARRARRNPPSPGGTRIRHDEEGDPGAGGLAA
jgi:hypothetical protein